MGIFLIFLHIIFCFVLIVVILLQSSKGGGLAGTFGGSGGGVIFGGRGAATFLSKATAIVAFLFFISCIGHTFLSRQSERPQSVIQQAAQEGTLTPSPASVLPGVSGGAEGTGQQPVQTPSEGTETKPAGTEKSNQ